ncbi:MAG: DNA mismatch repair endonuclease MutL [Clostridia bacterium]|nr:DNA mismatch repair endonuclease MutL [Clostridia bacterium]MCI9413486.1 DNA mismatch repair endonuclease MutL [Clostridia bacterium]
MGNIVLLDDNTINKIAAGEVIERPASVVKELMENSIDAGATAINVEIRNGGISYIRITDNGKGIAPDDMEIAFERHATSKIRKAEDLETVKSMGFRGEALASVAAISKIEMVSRTVEDEIGYRIEIEGGRIINKEETGCPKGTAITITDLFFNTPVRYKFLKKDFTEAGYIEDAVTRLALVHPEVAIKLINTGKTIIQTPGNNESKATIYSVFGKDVAENILDVDYTYEDIHITGVIGKPAIARSNRSNQLFFVNQRFIKDKTLTSAAEQGYKGMITIGKFGFLVLNIEMNPQKVDVNVHPAKLEVRFEEESKVFKAVYHTIKDTLLKGDLVEDTEREKVDFIEQKPITNTEEEQAVAANAKPVEAVQYNPNIEQKKDKGLAGLFRKMQNIKTDEENSSSNKEQANSYIENEEDPFVVPQKPEVITQVTDTKQLDNMETKIIDTKQVNEKLLEDVKKLDSLQIDPQTENFDEMYVRTFGSMPVEAKRENDKKAEQLREEEEKYQVKAEELTTTENISIFEEEKQTIPSYKFIGIAFSTYIILELDKELYILDQHAAHERILYEKVKKNYYSEEEKDSQLMLLPDIINLSHKEMDIARENMEMFQKAGFTLDEFGENTIRLTGVPNICLELNTKELFLETLDEINTVARTAKQEIEEKFIATVACKAAVKANMALTKEEVDKLMEQLLVLPNPFTCPHGRPTAIKMTKNDIEKKFSRR